MMGRQNRDQGHRFYEFNLENVIPTDHLLPRMNIFVAAALSDLHEQLRSWRPQKLLFSDEKISAEQF
jgi:hypothetical protein